MNGKKLINTQVNPSLLLILIFAIGIALGTALLKLPLSTTESISWLDALFTSTSAMTVTGLSVVDIGSHFSLFGQFIILLLIKIGGLGIMTFGVIIFLALGKRIGFKERILIQQSLNQSSLGGIIQLAKRLFVFSIIIELFGTVLLTIKWIPQLGLSKGIYYSIFHSIAAFNNAGFSLWHDNLVSYVGDPIVNLTISFLIIIGGIGFTVIADIVQKKSYAKLALHSKLMILGTIIINISAALMLYIIEFDNPQTLYPLLEGDKGWAVYFQAITTRTAGFNTIYIGGMDNTSLLLMVFLMFIGAGSASTGGGIKLTTFIVILLAVYTYAKGRKDIVLKERTIENSLIFKALAISAASIILTFTAVFLLTISEKQPFFSLLFEVISAFGTVGLSLGITAGLSSFGKIIIVCTMAIGKLGPLTLLFALARPEKTKLKYPNEDILIG